MGSLEISPPTRIEKKRGRSWWKLALVPSAAVLALLAWGMSSPVSSSPDDNYHLASIWCGLGDRAGLCETSPSDSAVKLVPQAAYQATCFAYNPGQSGECLSALFGDAGMKLIPTEATNASGGYPPIFYAAMGLFASTDVWASTALMRAVNALLFVGIVGLLWFALPLRRRGTLLWSFAISVVPLGLFIIPSTNPSSWALLSAGTLWLALLGWTETSGRRRWLLGGIALIATLMGAGARSDSAIFAAMSIVLVTILTFKRKRIRPLSVIYPLILVVIAGTLFLSASQSLVAASGLGNTTGQATESVLSLTVSNIVMAPSLWLGVFGSWGLGWLDTVLPAIVPVAAFGSFAAVLFAGLGQGITTRSFAWRKSISVLLVFAALWIFPVYVLVKTGAHVGAYVQPRYILPLIILLAGMLLLREVRNGPVLSKLQSLVIVGALSAANAVALFWNTRRYVTGTDVTGWNLNSGAEWWWAAMPSPMIAWMLGSLAFAAFLWLLSPALLPQRWPSVVPRNTPLVQIAQS
jgi:hypothetical protein